MTDIYSIYEGLLQGKDRTIANGDAVSDMIHVFDMLKDRNTQRSCGDWGLALDLMKSKYKPVKPTNMKKTGVFLVFERVEGGLMQKRKMRMSVHDPEKYWERSCYHEILKIVAHNGSGKYDMVIVDIRLDYYGSKIENITIEPTNTEYRNIFERKDKYTEPLYKEVFQISDEYTEVLSLVER